MSVPIQKKSQSVEKGILTPVALTIAAADFDKYLNEIDPYFEDKEPWIWMSLVDGLADTLPVEVEQVDSQGQIFTTILTLRLNGAILCQGIRILSAGTDASAVLTVGTGQ